jgi:PAS domain S-box-containing protein
MKPVSNRLSAATRISVGLSLLTMGFVLAAKLLGFIPDRLQTITKGRGELCEVIAIHVAAAYQIGDLTSIEAAANAIVKRNPDLLSLALRNANGDILFQTGDHQQLGSNASTDLIGTTAHVRIPICSNDSRRATLELCFRPLTHGGVLRTSVLSAVRLACIVALGGFVVYWLYLRRALPHLDSSTLVRERVEAALDTLAEGVLILNNDGRIAFANEAFTRSVGRSSADLRDRKASDMDWVEYESNQPPTSYPWEGAVRGGRNERRPVLKLRTASEGTYAFEVSCAPILGIDGRRKGTLAAFDDLTKREGANAELRRTLVGLEESLEEIRRRSGEVAGQIDGTLALSVDLESAAEKVRELLEISCPTQSKVPPGTSCLASLSGGGKTSAICRDRRG